MNSFHELIINRRSIRKYTGEILDPEQVRLILEAGLMAPAGKRLNPWHFVVIEDRETLVALSKAKAQGAGPLATAALGICLCADPSVSDTWVEDLSIASIQMQLQCTDLGLGSVWIQMRNRYDEEGNAATYNVRRILNLPDHFEVLNVISIGHIGEERKPYDTGKLQWEKVQIFSPEKSDNND
ncbi:MAG: nitroreductase family protein [Bacteroidales bacterium]|nr:nitroreductase family protein [Bacteroidales bacterium]